MCVCMCVCMFVYICQGFAGVCQGDLQKGFWLHVCMYVSICVCMYVIYVYMYDLYVRCMICMHIRMCVCMYVYLECTDMDERWLLHISTTIGKIIAGLRNAFQRLLAPAPY